MAFRKSLSSSNGTGRRRRKETILLNWLHEINLISPYVAWPFTAAKHCDYSNSNITCNWQHTDWLSRKIHEKFQLSNVLDKDNHNHAIRRVDTRSSIEPKLSCWVKRNGRVDFIAYIHIHIVGGVYKWVQIPWIAL